MKILKYIGIILLIILLGATAYAWYVKSSLTPSYSGTLAIQGLENSVEVYFTEHGVPHIYSDNDKDAFRALGYIHAMERLWQMDLLRHVGSGRLSELFGEELVDNDKFLRAINLNTYSKASAAAYRQLNHPSMPLVNAYLEGINEYIANNPKPLEYQILGLEVAPFELENVYEILISISLGLSIGHVVDPVVTELNQKLDSTYLQDLELYHYDGQIALKSYDSRLSEYSEATLKVLENMKVPLFNGSNSWVVGPQKTNSGEVILVNDPHLAYEQPSVYYEAHMVTPNLETYGHYVVGMPFPIIFHNESHAVGVTMFLNDDMDFYVEEVHPGDPDKYKHKGEWKNFDIREETIQVKGGEPVSFNIKSTIHGPIVSEVMLNKPLEETVAFHWVGTQQPNHLIEAIHGFAEANDMYEMEKAVSLLHAPGLNIMYGDSAGNVAWWAAAKLPVRRDNRATKTFYDGASGIDDITEYYDFEKNPHAINPPWHYVHTANNQPDTINGVVYAGYYVADDRGERIAEILDGDSDISVDKMKTMLLDDKAITMVKLKNILLDAVQSDEDTELIKSLASWQGGFDKEDFEPLIFQKWVHETMILAQKDEMGEDLWPTYKKSYIADRATEHIIGNEASPWWDNIHTPEQETRTQLIQQAFKHTITTLKAQWGADWTQWKWGDAHQVLHKHALGDVLGFLNVGPYPMSGGNDVINNVGYNYDDTTNEQPALLGPGARRIIDFSNIRDNSWNIQPTGQSGNYFSEFYSDQAEMYAKGEFRKMEMKHQKIKSSSNKIIMQPSN